MVASDCEESHSKHLIEVLTILKQNGVSLNFAKSDFFKTQVKYFGLIISHEGIRPDISRIMGDFKEKTPKTCKQLMSLIGRINWFIPFIKQLSSRMSNITDKLKQENNFTWSDADKPTVEDIYNEIKKQTLLSYPDYSKSFTLSTDASLIGVGGILYQENNLIGMFSYKFKHSEQRYNTIEGEFLAVYLS